MENDNSHYIYLKQQSVTYTLYGIFNKNTFAFSSIRTKNLSFDNDIFVEGLITSAFVSQREFFILFELEPFTV